MVSGPPQQIEMCGETIVLNPNISHSSQYQFCIEFETRGIH